MSAATILDWPWSRANGQQGEPAALQKNFRDLDIALRL